MTNRKPDNLLRGIVWVLVALAALTYLANNVRHVPSSLSAMRDSIRWQFMSENERDAHNLRKMAEEARNR